VQHEQHHDPWPAFVQLVELSEQDVSDGRRDRNTPGSGGIGGPQRRIQ